MKYVFEVIGKQLKLRDYNGPSTRKQAFEIRPYNLKTVDSCIDKVTDFEGLVIPFISAYEIWRYKRIDLFYENFDDEIALEKIKQFDIKWHEDFFECFSGTTTRADVLRQWLDELTKKEFTEVITYIKSWLEEDYDAYEFDEFDNRMVDASCGYDAAFKFFENEHELCEKIDIYIVEGDRPFSNYLAAEIYSSVEQANQIVQKLELNYDVEFVRSNE